MSMGPMPVGDDSLLHYITPLVAIQGPSSQSVNVVVAPFLDVINPFHFWASSSVIALNNSEN